MNTRTSTKDSIKAKVKPGAGTSADKHVRDRAAVLDFFKQAKRCLLLVAVLMISTLGASFGLSASDINFGSSKALLDPDAILPVDEAFVFVHLQEQKTLRLSWQVQEGYYLYRDRMSFMVNGEAVEVELPAGPEVDDPYFGRVQIYPEFIELILDKPADEMEISYQGCAKVGVCYPPRKRTIKPNTKSRFSLGF